MSGLLDEVLTAHGGLERWCTVTALTAHGRFGGLLRSRFPENRMANVTVRVQLAEQHAAFHGSRSSSIPGASTNAQSARFAWGAGRLVFGGGVLVEDLPERSS